MFDSAEDPEISPIEKQIAAKVYVDKLMERATIERAGLAVEMVAAIKAILLNSDVTNIQAYHKLLPLFLLPYLDIDLNPDRKENTNEYIVQKLRKLFCTPSEIEIFVSQVKHRFGPLMAYLLSEQGEAMREFMAESARRGLNARLIYSAVLARLQDQTFSLPDDLSFPDFEVFESAIRNYPQYFSKLQGIKGPLSEGHPDYAHISTRICQLGVEMFWPLELIAAQIMQEWGVQVGMSHISRFLRTQFADQEQWQEFHDIKFDFTRRISSLFWGQDMDFEQRVDMYLEVIDLIHRFVDGLDDSQRADVLVLKHGSFTRELKGLYLAVPIFQIKYPKFMQFSHWFRFIARSYLLSQEAVSLREG